MTRLEAREMAKPLQNYLFDKFYDASQRLQENPNDCEAKEERSKFRNYMSILSTLAAEDRE